MPPIFLLALMCAFPAVTHPYVMDDQNEELLANHYFQVNRRSTKSSVLDSDEHQNVFKADLENLGALSDEEEYDYDDGHLRKSRTGSLHVKGKVVTTAKEKYQMDATFIPTRSAGYDSHDQCETKNGNDTAVTADLKVVKRVGIKTTYKMTITLRGPGYKSVIADCIVKTNKGKLFKLHLSLQRLKKKKSRMLASPKRISARRAQLYSKEEDKAMFYSPRQMPLLIGE